MSKDLNKLHYQMLRKTADSGTTMDGALSKLKTKIQGDSVQPGEPVVIFYNDPSGNTGAHLAVPTSGVTAETAEGYIFANRKEVFDRMEEDEEVTTAALIDLDDRVTTVSGDLTTLREEFDELGGDFANIKLTEDVKATGTDAGAISNGQTIASGTSFTEFVRKLLIRTLDYTAHAPSLTSNVTWSPSGDIVEVGTDITFTLDATKNQGYFTASVNDGFPSDKTNVQAGTETLGSVTYTIKSGNTTVTSTTSSTYTINSAPDATYTVSATMPYTGVTGSTLGLRKNTTPSTEPADSTASYSNNSATGATKTVKAHYKIYYGTTSAQTADSFVFGGENSNVVASASTWLSGNTVVLPYYNDGADYGTSSDSWYNGGQNFFILTNGYLNFVAQSSAPTENLKSNFFPDKDTTKTLPTREITIGGGNSATYRLYYWNIVGGADTKIINVTIGKNN